MKFINLTPHSIVIIRREDVEFDSAIRKYTANADCKCIAEIPSSGVASAKILTDVSSAKILIESAEFIYDVPTFRKTITDCDPLPVHDPDDIIIVSALYATAFRKVHPDSDVRLYTISDPVYSQDGRTILGCLGICEAF